MRRKRIAMATKKEIDQHLKKALKEIGEITPFFDKEVGEWIFSHPLYPVEYGGESKEDVVENYPKYLREFIKHRLDDRLDSLVEKKTKGRGGKRPGAGRPRGTKKSSTKVVRLNTSVANWISTHENEVLDLIAGEKILVTAKRQKRA
jgi:hypothetical protein